MRLHPACRRRPSWNLTGSERYDHLAADGTRIPNFGRKTLETVSDGGSTKLSHTFQIPDTLRPLSSAGKLAGAGNLVVFHRKGGFIVNPGYNKKRVNQEGRASQ